VNNKGRTLSVNQQISRFRKRHVGTPNTCSTQAIDRTRKDNPGGFTVGSSSGKRPSHRLAIIRDAISYCTEGSYLIYGSVCTPAQTEGK
jgi:hypothetical protein